MEALSGFLRSKHDFVAGKVAEGKVPNTPQLCAFLAEVCKGLLPLVSAEGVPDAVAADLRLGFESVGWDVKTNRPLASRIVSRRREAALTGGGGRRLAVSQQAVGRCWGKRGSGAL